MAIELAQTQHICATTVTQGASNACRSGQGTTILGPGLEGLLTVRRSRLRAGLEGSRNGPERARLCRSSPLIAARGKTDSGAIRRLVPQGRNRAPPNVVAVAPMSAFPGRLEWDAHRVRFGPISRGRTAARLRLGPGAQPRLLGSKGKGLRRLDMFLRADA